MHDLVEDHPDTMECFTLYLQHRGYSVTQATSIAETVEKLPDSRRNLLIADIGLQDGSGWELMKCLNLSEPIYAVAISVYGCSEDRDQSENVGFRHHLLKPIAPEKLDAVLKEAIFARQ